jgi:hypothetical protein
LTAGWSGQQESPEVVGLFVFTIIPFRTTMVNLTGILGHSAMKGHHCFLHLNLKIVHSAEGGYHAKKVVCD